MPRALGLYRSSIGKKVVMAATGIVLVGFVVGHMLGNLKLYLPAHDGVAALDHYAEGLRTLGDPFLPEGAFLWIFRAGLLVALILHVHAAVTLTLANRAARPVGYKKVQHEESTFASRTMIYGGLFVLAFLVYHILHLTTGQAHPAFEAGAVHQNVVSGLQVGWVAAFYLAANLLLGLHLWHGVWSMLQTLGVSHPRYDALRRGLAWAVALFVVAGNLSIPIAVLTGVVR